MRIFFRYNELSDDSVSDHVKSGIVINTNTFNPNGFEDIYDVLTKEEKVDNQITIMNTDLVMNKKDSISNALKLPSAIRGNANLQEFTLQINSSELVGTSLGDIAEVPDRMCRNSKYNSLVDITALELLTFSIMKSINQKLKVGGYDKIRFFVIEGIEQRLGKTMLQDLKLMILQTGLSRGFLLQVNSAAGGLLIKVITDYNLRREELQELLSSKITKENILFDLSKLDFDFIHEAMILNLNQTKIAKFAKAVRTPLIDARNKYISFHKNEDLLRIYVYSVYLLCAPLLDNYNVSLTINSITKTKLYDLNKLMSKLFVFKPYEEVDNMVYPAFRAILDEDENYDLKGFIDSTLELSDTALLSFRTDTDLYTVLYNVTTKDFLNIMKKEVEITGEEKPNSKPVEEKPLKPIKPIAHIGDGNTARDEVAATNTNFSTHHNDLSNARERSKREKMHDANNKYGVSNKVGKGAKGIFKGTSLLGLGIFTGLFKGLKFANKNKKDTALTAVFVIAIVAIYIIYKKI